MGKIKYFFIRICFHLPVMKVEKESGSIAQVISGYASSEMFQRWKLHNYWKPISHFLFFWSNLLILNLDTVSVALFLSNISTGVFSQLQLEFHKPCVPVGPSNLFLCVRLSWLISDFSTLRMELVALFPCGTSNFLSSSRLSSGSLITLPVYAQNGERLTLAICLSLFIFFSALCSTASLS